MEQGIKMALFNQLLALENKETETRTRLSECLSGVRAVSNYQLLNEWERNLAIISGEIGTLYTAFKTLGIDREYIEWLKEV